MKSKKWIGIGVGIFSIILIVAIVRGSKIDASDIVGETWYGVETGVLGIYPYKKEFTLKIEKGDHDKYTYWLVRTIHDSYNGTVKEDQFTGVMSKTRENFEKVIAGQITERKLWKFGEGSGNDKFAIISQKGKWINFNGDVELQVIGDGHVVSLKKQ